MENDPIEQLKYPIGKAIIPEFISVNDINTWIGVLASFPSKIRFITQNLTEEQLATTKRLVITVYFMQATSI